MQPWQNGKPLEEDSVPPYFVFTARCNDEDNRARMEKNGSVADKALSLDIRRMGWAFGTVAFLLLLGFGLYSMFGCGVFH